MHAPVDSTDSELPRLDVSLAGDENSVGNTGKSLEKTSGQEKTKLRLPRPGEETTRFSPADFIAPVGGEESPISEEIGEPLDTEDQPEPVDELTEESYLIVDPGEAPAEPDPEPIPLDSIESLDETDFESSPAMTGGNSEVSEPTESPVEEQRVEEAPSALPEWDPVALTESETAPVELPENEPEEETEPSLNEGSFERLFAQQAAPEEEDTETFPAGPVSNPAPAATSQPEPITEEREVPQFSGVEAKPVVRKETQADSDVLDEMFGSSSSTSFRPKKSTLIMGGVFVLLAIIAVAMVISVGKALSFFGPAPTTMDPVTVAPESMKAKEEPEPDVAKSTPAPRPEAEQALSLADDVPAEIDPDAEEKVAENEVPRSASGSTLTLPGDTENPVRIMDSSGGSQPSAPAPQESPAAQIGTPTMADEPEALSFDERVQNIVNGNGLNADAGSAMSQSLNSTPTAPTSPDSYAAGVSEKAAAPAGVENYNPPASFAAPGPDDGPLGKTHDLIDAYLRAPDWETRVKYVYQGESLRPTMEEYYKKWPDRRLDRYSHQLYAMESDPEYGGPYWVYLISVSDNDGGYPFIIRVENGNLKVDWESHSEFFDQHWVKFQQGGIAAPHTFRVAIERVSDYYGPDRDQFENLEDYLVYKINPPYGGDDEFMEYAFVKKGTELAEELDANAGLGDDALAVILTLDYEQFPHGEKHLVVKDYVTEGWFR